MNQNLNKYIFSTPNIYNDEEAVELKMKQIHPKLFGLFCPVRYECIKKEKVYVPYMLLVFNYKITRNSAKADKGKKGIFDRSGKIGIVFDMNEVHVKENTLVPSVSKVCHIPEILSYPTFYDIIQSFSSFGVL